MTEGETKGAAACLWSYELPDKFENLRIGQKIRVERGCFAGQTLRVVGKLHNRFDKFVFCDHVKQS